jgi:23S rRNA (adenine2503-C2)-methyltransferase
MMNTSPISKITWRKASQDGSIKYSLENDQQLQFEAIYFRLPFQTTKGYCYTICISSQAGCALNCSFCATGDGGLFGNLSSDDMLGQVNAIRQELITKKIHQASDHFQVALMGMGEPLMNYNHVTDFCILARKSYPSLNKISLSTVGIIPRIQQLSSRNDLHIDLFVSIHSPYDAQRDKIIPINRKYPLDQLIKTCYAYAKAKNSFVNASYMIIGGINDSDQHAIDFCHMLDPKYFRIQVLLYNEGSSSPYKKPSVSSAENFKKIAESYGFETMIILSKGQDINGGCGQLLKLKSPTSKGKKIHHSDSK